MVEQHFVCQCIYDPQNLLRGHEPKFKELYLDSETWRHPFFGPRTGPTGHQTYPEENLDLTGLISFGARSRPLAYQMWFTEQHPDICHIGPTERWVEHAASRLSHDIANRGELYTGIIGDFLREYATHAVRDFIVDEMNMALGWDTRIRVYPVLDSILGISRTPEEGAWARGELIFAEPAMMGGVDFLIRFPENGRPMLENYKHVRKLLLSVENSPRKLVSDGQQIVGIANSGLPEFCIAAEFKGRIGFLRINDTRVCSFTDGRFQASTLRAKLVQVEALALTLARQCPLMCSDASMSG
jgi:Probable sensor domain DACND/Probable sensor domain DACNH